LKEAIALLNELETQPETGWEELNARQDAEFN
jgi:hypothetical protein